MFTGQYFFQNNITNIYPKERIFQQSNSSDDKLTTFSELDSQIHNLHCTRNLCQKRFFDFNIVNFPCLDGDVTSSPSYGTYQSQLFGFARYATKLTIFMKGIILYLANFLSKVFSIINLGKHLPNYIIRI